MALDFEDVKEKFDDVHKRIDRQNIRIESIEKHQTEIMINQAKFEAIVTTRFDGIEKLIKDDSDKKREHETKMLEHIIQQSESNNKGFWGIKNQTVKFFIQAAIITLCSVLGINSLS